MGAYQDGKKGGGDAGGNPGQEQQAQGIVRKETDREKIDKNRQEEEL